MQQTVQAFQSFINPFQIETSQPLTSLSSGAAMPEEVRYDVLNALKNGKTQKEKFIRDRLQTKSSFSLNPSRGTDSRQCRLPHLKGSLWHQTRK